MKVFTLHPLYKEQLTLEHSLVLEYPESLRHLLSDTPKYTALLQWKLLWGWVTCEEIIVDRAFDEWRNDEWSLPFLLLPLFILFPKRFLRKYFIAQLRWDNTLAMAGTRYFFYYMFFQRFLSVSVWEHSKWRVLVREG